MSAQRLVFVSDIVPADRVGSPCHIWLPSAALTAWGRDAANEAEGLPKLGKYRARGAILGATFVLGLTSWVAVGIGIKALIAAI